MTWLVQGGGEAAMPKRVFKERASALRMALMDAHLELREAAAPALMLVAGVDGAGKGDTVNLMMKWLDPRFVRVRSFDHRTEEEATRPDLWRYWRALPPRGHLAILLSAWYSEPLLGRAAGESRAWLMERLDRVCRLERMLADDGYAIVKFWLHLDSAQQEARFRELESDPRESWRVTPKDWEHWRRYEHFANAAEEILEATHCSRAPWTVVDGSDPRRRALEVGEGVLRAFREAAAPGSGEAPVAPIAPAAKAKDAPPELASLPKAEYRKQLASRQGELNALYRRARERGVSLIIVFEGPDASGKGGAIRRLVPAFDARCIDVVRTGPPTDEEQQHHYLWRFWRRVPASGRVALFDRSWYGRVLVERVEEIASEEQWRRAYGEINDFESQLVDHGALVVKFWLQIDKAEQKRRFEERRRMPHKRWKLTDDDLRNRSRWKAYDTALRDLLAETDTPHAPWSVVPANDKRAARLEILSTLRDRLVERLVDEGDDVEGDGEVPAPGIRLA